MSDEKQRKRGLKVPVSIGVAATICAALLLSGCTDGEAKIEEDSTVQYVNTFTINGYSDTFETTLVGRVRAPKEVGLAFELSGRLESLADSTGVSFESGDELGSLIKRRYELAYEEAKQRLEYSEKEYGRRLSLLEGGSSTQAEFDRVENSRELARISFDKAKKDLEDCVLTAPFDGKLATKLTEVGSFVMPGQSVLIYQEIGITEVEVFRTENQLASLLKSLEDGDVELSIANGYLAGTNLILKDYSTSPDTITGAYRVSLSIESKEVVKLLPGAPLRISITERLDQLGAQPVQIPANALVSMPDGNFSVWLLNEGQSNPKFRAIEIGRVNGKRVEVIQGLGVGDRVVTSGSSLLRDDSIVVANGNV